MYIICVLIHCSIPQNKSFNIFLQLFRDLIKKQTKGLLYAEQVGYDKNILFEYDKIGKPRLKIWQAVAVPKEALSRIKLRMIHHETATLLFSRTSSLDSLTEDHDQLDHGKFLGITIYIDSKLSWKHFISYLEKNWHLQSTLYTV